VKIELLAELIEKNNRQLMQSYKETNDNVKELVKKTDELSSKQESFKEFVEEKARSSLVEQSKKNYERTDFINEAEQVGINLNVDFVSLFYLYFQILCLINFRIVQIL
jgi:hypothetical protein